MLFVAVGILSCESDLEMNSGLEGTVIRGPIRGGPQIVGEINEEPFSTTFHVKNLDDETVKSFTSDQNGAFRVQLLPGTYHIVADDSAPIMMPATQIKEVVVTEDSFSTVILYFDTGIR